MAKPKGPLTDDEKQRIAELLEQELSYAQVAKQTGRSVGSVSRVAKAIGYSAPQSRADLTRNARQKRSAFCAERRAEQAAKMAERVDAVLDRFTQPCVVYAFGGRHGDFSSHEFDEPPPAELLKLAQTVSSLTSTIIKIDQHDNRADEDLSAVDRWLRSMMGDSTDE